MSRSLKTIFSYARLPKKELIRFKNKARELGIEIVATAAHDGEQKNATEVIPSGIHRKWAEYSSQKHWTEKLNKKLFDQLIDQLNPALLPMVERYGPFNGGSLEAATRLNYDFSVALEMIEKTSPDLVVFAKTPESGLEICLYLLAKHYDIPTYFSCEGGFPHSRTIKTNLWNPTLDECWTPNEKTIPICNLDKPGIQLSNLTKKNLEEIRDSELVRIPDYMENEGLQFNKHNKNLQLDMGYSIRNAISLNKNIFSGPGFRKKLFEYSERLSVSLEEINWSKFTFYYPLHYQPELTSMPLGKEYVNQIMSIKIISDNLKSNEQIVVKEHPSIFAKTSRTNTNYRTTSFFDWLNKIPNVKLASVNSSSFYIMMRSNAVITIRGTVGMEAMIRHIPVLILGSASYQNGPGVVKIGNDCDINFYLDKIRHSTEYNDSEVDKFLIALDGCSYHLAESPFSTENYEEIIQTFYITTLLEGLRKVYS